MSQYATITTKSGACDLPPELDPMDEGLVYGNNVPGPWDSLASIAEELSLTPLTAFESPDEEGDEEVEDSGVWHDPADGVRTVSGLLQFLRESSPERLKKYFDEQFIAQNLEFVIWDLRAYEVILTKAQQENDPFRIGIC